MLLLPTLNVIAVNGEETNEWSRVVRLISEAYSWQPNARRPDVVIDSNNNIHIVWLSQDERYPSQRLMYLKIDEKGNKESLLALASHPKLSKPEIDLDIEGNIIVVWIEDDLQLYYAKIDKSGSSFLKDSIPLDVKNIDQMTLQIDELNNVHLILRNGTPGAYHLKYMVLELQPDKILNSSIISNGPYLSTPVFKIDSDGRAHIVYWESSQGGWDLIYVMLDPNDNSIILRNNIGTTITLKEQNVPSLAINSAGNIHIIWTNQIEGGKVKSSHISYCEIDKIGKRISNVSMANQRTGWPFLSIDSRDTVHITFTDWSRGKMEIYYCNLNTEKSQMINYEKLSNSPSGSWLSINIVDKNDFIHIFWLEFFKKGVRICYKNTRYPAKTNFLSEFMDTYGFLSWSEAAQGLFLSLTVSILLAPVIMFYPFIIIAIIGVFLTKIIVSDLDIIIHLEKLSGEKWVFFVIAIGISKFFAIFFRFPLTNGITYQIGTLLLSFASSMIIQRYRKKTLEDIENWGLTALIIGLFDGFYTILPYILLFITGYV